MRRRLFNDIQVSTNKSTGYYLFYGDCETGWDEPNQISEEEFNSVYTGEKTYWGDVTRCWKPGEIHSDWGTPPDSMLPPDYKGIISVYACTAA